MAAPATTLAGRLLCASACAYSVIEGESKLDPDAAVPYYGGVGFNEPPTAFLAGRQDIDSCIVGTPADGVVVAFRGTLPLDGPFTVPVLLDWVNDLNARPVPWDGLGRRGPRGAPRFVELAVGPRPRRGEAAAGPGRRGRPPARHRPQ